MIALFLLYTTIVSLLCAVASRLIEEPWKRTSSRGFFLKYTLFTIYCIAPWGFLPLLSRWVWSIRSFAGRVLSSSWDTSSRSPSLWG